MSKSLFRGVKPVVILAIVLVLGLPALGLFIAETFNNNQGKTETVSVENEKRDNSKDKKSNDKESSDTSTEQDDSDASVSTTRNGKRLNRRAAPQTEIPGVKYANYEIKYVDEGGKVVFKKSERGLPGQEIEVTAEDLFEKGYELFDAKNKTLKLDSDNNEVVFNVGKARELMSLSEFTKHEVRYDYPIEFRNLDFTGRQEDLQDFVVKKIYHREKDTGVFYGTKDQAELIRKTMLNGSFQGAYARYAYNIRDIPAKHIEGDKYELKIEFDYVEHPEWMKLGEQKVTEFYQKYNKLNLSDIEKAKLIQDWLMKNITVFTPPNNKPEWFHNTGGQRRVHFPSSVMIDHEGVCLSYAMTYARLAERMGLEVRVIQGWNGMSAVGQVSPSPQLFLNAAEKMFLNPDTTTYRLDYFNHAWNLVKVGGSWYHVDTFQDIGLMQYTPEENQEPYHYFLRSDEFMRQHVYKMGKFTQREYNLQRAWNRNRILAAPTSKDVPKNLPNLAEKD